MSDGFLSRWSRRKRDEARRPPEVAPEAAPAEPVAAPADDEGTLTPEELARLPSLDALTAATDLTPFLRAGVPRALRNAALRRMWSVDPAIRDFVSEAREYAYDWNTPGGVPGTGGAISAEDVRAMVEKVFGSAEEKPSTASHQSDVARENADVPSPRGPGEAVPPPVEGEGGPEGNGDGVFPDETPAAPLPHPRVVPSGIDAPPSVARDEGGETLSPPAAGGDSPHPPLLSSPADAVLRLAPDRPEPAPEPPTPPRLRRHGGALPI
ncbi:DUF3306 domain-containing protein [Methylobacterium terricola]|uniref:DUF3306 domain-containing protein n=1 Tax=Methylobacterium terricola TaxID=2583531 RepID=A0A5C4LFR0_9HYPH|nr:DUF3306 domain-containing protein [Methylobacterium terricola]